METLTGRANPSFRMMRENHMDLGGHIAESFHFVHPNIVTIDADDTLLRKGKLGSDTAVLLRHAIGELRKNAHVFLFSGRSYRVLFDVHRRLGTDAPVIMESGAALGDPENNSITVLDSGLHDAFVGGREQLYGYIERQICGIEGLRNVHILPIPHTEHSEIHANRLRQNGELGRRLRENGMEGEDDDGVVLVDETYMTSLLLIAGKYKNGVFVRDDRVYAASISAIREYAEAKDIPFPIQPYENLEEESVIYVVDPKWRNKGYFWNMLRASFAENSLEAPLFCGHVGNHYPDDFIDHDGVKVMAVGNGHPHLRERADVSAPENFHNGTAVVYCLNAFRRTITNGRMQKDEKGYTIKP